MENNQSKDMITDQDFRRLASAPVLVFMLVAGADGTVDKKEINTFKRLIVEPKYAMLMAAYTEVGVPVGEFMQEVLSSIKNPLEDLFAIGSLIDGKLGEVAKEYKSMLLDFGHEIASASGGFLGIFGSKISKEEHGMLLLIEASLGQNEGGAATVPGKSGEALDGNVFPVLKAADWVSESRGDVLLFGIYQNDEIKDGEPAIAYAVDQNDSLHFLNESPNIKDTHKQAMHNLEQRLEGLEWEEISFELPDTGGKKASGLVFSGDFYCAEGLLVENIMRKAHEKLDAAMVIAIAPVRGELFVTRMLNPEDMEPEILAFVTFAMKRYFNADTALIAPTCWIVRNGCLAGHIHGLEGLEQEVRLVAEQEAEHESSMLQHDAEMEEYGNGIRLKVECQVYDAEVMLKNLQHVMRGYVYQAVDDHRFNGMVDVLLKVHDANLESGEYHELQCQLDSMFEFLNVQFGSIHVQAENGNPIQLSYQLN